MTSRPDLGRVSRHRLQGHPAVAAERLEERDLRLDGNGVGSDDVDDPLAEALDRTRSRGSSEHGLPP